MGINTNQESPVGSAALSCAAEKCSATESPRLLGYPSVPVDQQKRTTLGALSAAMVTLSLSACGGGGGSSGVTVGSLSSAATAAVPSTPSIGSSVGALNQSATSSASSALSSVETNTTLNINPSSAVPSPLSSATSTPSFSSASSAPSSTPTTSTSASASRSSRSSATSSHYSSAPSVRSSANDATTAAAVQFLAQAGLSSKVSEIDAVNRLGFEGWIDHESTKQGFSLVTELWGKGYEAPMFQNNIDGIDNVIWKKLLTADNPLRVRVALALSEMIVVSAGLRTSYRQFALAYYWDILEANALGNYRDLLEAITKSPAMGGYLSFLNSRKASGNSLPDENYAREIMQLFSIGLYELNMDGTRKLTNGNPTETYTQQDISQLARVFTGWVLDYSAGTDNDPALVSNPLVQNASQHEMGTKTFLGVTIPENTDGEASLQIVLDTLMAHPNMAPFVCRQLIQRLVTSHPEPSYVARVASVFNDNGKGIKGDLAAVIKAILLDNDARASARLSRPMGGKLREPMLRFVHWARNFNLTDITDQWKIGDTSDPATGLGQSPLRSLTVFNFYRPGYIPASASIDQRTVPELQITTEVSVAGYINFIRACISTGIAGAKPDYASLLVLAPNAKDLVDELNITLAGGQLSSATLTIIENGLNSLSPETSLGLRLRVYAALTMVMASPEYIVQK